MKWRIWQLAGIEPRSSQLQLILADHSTTSSTTTYNSCCSNKYRLRQLRLFLCFIEAPFFAITVRQINGCPINYPTLLCDAILPSDVIPFTLYLSTYTLFHIDLSISLSIYLPTPLSILFHICLYLFSSNFTSIYPYLFLSFLLLVWLLSNNSYLV